MKAAATIGKLPGVGRVAKTIYRRIKRLIPFPGVERYWTRRYERGDTSGPGSYGELAAFKAEILNEFVDSRGVTTVIEYGCGDGNQLKLATYASYIGFDISPPAVGLCRRVFAGDPTKQFKLMDEYAGETAELTLSIDVIYHLVEDAIFEDYMHRLFDSSTAYVIAYSSNTDVQFEPRVGHVRHRKVTDWIQFYKPEWRLAQEIPNKYPYSPALETGSWANFFIFMRRDT